MKQGVLLIVGHKGSGKTVLARRFLDQQPRSVTIDVMGEFGGVVIEDPHSLADYLERVRDLERWRVSYRDKGHSGIPPALVFKMLRSLRDCWIGLEESSLWMAPGRSVPEVGWFFSYGRHNRISVVSIARRPHEIDPLVRSQADVIVSFRQQEPRDLDWIRQIGGDGAAERIESLSEHEWDYVVCEHAEIQETLDRISEEVTTTDGPMASGDGDSTDPGGGDSVAVAAEDREGRRHAEVDAEGLRALSAPDPERDASDTGGRDDSPGDPQGKPDAGGKRAASGRRRSRTVRGGRARDGAAQSSGGLKESA